MKNKSKKRHLKWAIPVGVFALLLGLLAFVAFSDASFVPSPDRDTDFSRVIRDNVAQSARVIDIAMLGAHNSFSNRIDGRSPIDPNDDSAPAQSGIVTFTRGVFSRMGRNQYSNAAGLLLRGVRYIDVRLTYNNGWYTENTLISAPFEYYLRDVLAFLHYNPGELIIFDLHDVRTGGIVTFESLWAYITTIEVNGQSLFDFVHHDPAATPLSDLTLADVTQNGASGGVVIFADNPVGPGSLHYYRGDNLRSLWHNQQHTDDLLALIEAEHQYLLQGGHDHKLRVSQSMLSPSLWGAGLLDSLLRWSYLRINAIHNVQLAERGDFARWLTTTPIIKVGHAESSMGNFNREIINIINAFNRGL